MNRPEQSANAIGARTIAWDGVSFQVPANWELAVYKFQKKGVTRVEIEDEFAVRLEAEWIRPRRPLDMQNILERYELAAKKLTMRADHSRKIENLPDGWHATNYALSEVLPNKKARNLRVAKHWLVTGFYLAPGSKFFCFVILHFLPQDKEDPVKIMKLVASEFREHSDRQIVPWQLFDIAFELPRDFLLENTLFDVGAKLMIFRWRLRRFYLWHLSCADMFLKKDVNVAEWVCAYINDSRVVRGGAFHVAADGRIVWKRKRRHIVAHRDEIARWCFVYEVRYRVDRDRNQLIFWVFNHRKPDDLKVIPRDLFFS